MARRESFLTPMVPKNKKEVEVSEVQKIYYGICSRRAFAVNTANISPYFEAKYPFNCYVLKSNNGSLEFVKKVVTVDSVSEWSPQVLYVRELIGKDNSANNIYDLYILLKVDNIHERRFQFAVSPELPKPGGTVKVLSFRKNFLTGKISCDTSETLEITTPVKNIYSEGSPKGTTEIYKDGGRIIIFSAETVGEIAI